MSVEAVIATQVIDTTTIGRTVMTAANAAAIRSAIDAQVTLVSATNIKTVNGTSLLGSGDITTGGLTGTGSVDNAVLRADGTGGATLQNSALVIADNYTASPNNTVNHASLQVTGATTNVSVSIVPKGTGAFCVAVPDGTSAGGNARGTQAVDLQLTRPAGATQVASGLQSFAAGAGNIVSGIRATGLGNSNTASGQESFTVGSGNVSSGNYSFCCGALSTASNTACGAIGYQLTASATYAIASGINAGADRYAVHAHSSGRFAANGDAQSVLFVARKKTTDATPVTLMLDGATTRLTIPSGKILVANVLISGIKSDGSVACCYSRKVAIKNLAGTTALVGTVETIGTDIEDSAGCDVTITADNTNDALDISVTGIAAETWRWVAVVEGLEIAYGT